MTELEEYLKRSNHYDYRGGFESWPLTDASRFSNQ
jgi:hypothetical protein